MNLQIDMWDVLTCEPQTQGHLSALTLSICKPLESNTTVFIPCTMYMDKYFIKDNFRKKFIAK